MTNSRSTAELTFFGEPERPLFGAVHMPPDGMVRGGALICGSIAKEGYDTNRGLRLLAESLADSGVLAVRFDLPGTGESATSQYAPDLADDWSAAIVAAMDFLATLGIRSPVVIGLRVGALLLTQIENVAERATAVALWDPVLSGRQFLRGQTVLHNLSVGQPDSDARLIELVGASMDPATARHLSSMRVSPSLCHRPTLLAVRTVDGTKPAVRELVDRGAELIDIGDPSGFVSSDTILVDLPRTAVAAITDWTLRQVPASAAKIEPPVPVRSARFAVTDRAGRSTPILTTVSTAASGAVVFHSRPADDSDRVGRTLVLHSTANDNRVGPARLWVELSREVAANGCEVWRYDRPGVGEAGEIDPLDDVPKLYTAQSRATTLSISAMAARSPAPVIHAGICSGAWNAAFAAVNDDRQGPVVLVNPLLWRLSTSTSDTELAVMVAASTSAPVPTQVTGANAIQYRLRSRLGSRVRAMIPYGALTLLGHAKVLQAPQVLLGELAQNRIDASIVFSPWDWERFAFNRGQKALERTRERFGFTADVSVSSDGDHPCLHLSMREMIRSRVLDSLGGPDVTVRVPEDAVQRSPAAGTGVTGHS